MLKKEQENHKDWSSVEILNNAFTKYFQEISFGTELLNATIEKTMEQLYLQTLIDGEDVSTSALRHVFLHSYRIENIDSWLFIL